MRPARHFVAGAVAGFTGGLVLASTAPAQATCPHRVVQFCDQQHRNIPRLRRQVPDPLLEIHPDTAKAGGIEDGQWVVLETAKGRVRLKAKFRGSLHPRVVTTQYGWWQGCRELDRPAYDPFGPDGANANLLIANEAIDPISASVPHRSQMCRVQRDRVVT